jgi:L-lysine 2,3-aminomutase
VLNQAVLLKGVNDSAQILTDLVIVYLKQVMPTHVLDKVKGLNILI